MSVVNKDHVLINTKLNQNAIVIDALKLWNLGRYQKTYSEQELATMGWLSDDIKDIKTFIDLVLFEPENGMKYVIKYKQDIDEEKKDQATLPIRIQIGLSNAKDRMFY